MAWHKDDLLLTGTEAGSIHVWDVLTSMQICERAQAHQTRVRGLVVDVQQPSAAVANMTQEQPQGRCIFASAASDGTIKTWRFSAKGVPGGLQPVSELTTGARLTCLTLIRPALPSKEAVAQHKQAKAKQQKLAKLHKAKPSEKGIIPPQKAGVSRNKKEPKPKQADKAVPAQADLKRAGVVENGVVDFTDAAVRAHSGPTGANSVQLGKQAVKQQSKSSKRKRY